jgi:Fe-S cluster biogenesis protein NfuA
METNTSAQHNHEAEQVTEVLRCLQPAMQADGGGVELVSIEHGVVSVRLKGTCLACPSSSLTMKLGIERTLKEKIAWVKEVVRVF